MYIFDGEHQSFAMLDIAIDINDACHHPKVTNIRKTKRKTEKLRNIVKTGKGCLSIYLPSPWNEYHIIGGRTNIKHLKWSSTKKSFVNVSETNSILGRDHKQEITKQEITDNKFNNQGICATQIYFSSKFKQFILMGGGINNDFDCIWNLSYPSTESKGFWWLKSLSKLPYKNMSKFGSIMFNQQYIITFGGIAIKTNSSKPQKPKPIDDIFILDIERNEWRKSKSLCPKHGIFHAVYLPKFKKIHLFDMERRVKKNGNEFQHWVIDLDYILKQTMPFKRKIFDVDAHEAMNAYNDDENVKNNNDEMEVKNAEEIDPQQHILYKKKTKQNDKIQKGDISKTENMNDGMINNGSIGLREVQRHITGLRDEVSLIWDFITQLKQDMQTIKEYQLEIIKNSEQNSLRIIDLHKNMETNYVKKKDKEKKKKKKKEKQLRRAQTYAHNINSRDFMDDDENVDDDSMNDDKGDEFSLNYNYSPQSHKKQQSQSQSPPIRQSTRQQTMQKVPTEPQQAQKQQKRPPTQPRPQQAPKTKAAFDIFDTDDSDEVDEYVNNINNNNKPSNNETNINNELEDREQKVESKNIGNNKNLSMLLGDVEYDSIEMDDTAEDQRLKAKVKQQIKRAESDGMNNVGGDEKVKLKEWLTKHRLGEYYKIFIERGYESLDQLTKLDDATLLTQIGVTKLVHRRKLIAKLKQYDSQK